MNENMEFGNTETVESEPVEELLSVDSEEEMNDESPTDEVVEDEPTEYSDSSVDESINEEDESVEESDGKIVVDETENSNVPDDAVILPENFDARYIEDPNIEDSKPEPVVEPAPEVVEAEEPVGDLIEEVDPTHNHDHANMKQLLHFTHNDADAIGCALVCSSLKDYETTNVFCSIEQVDSTIVEIMTDRLNNNNIPDWVIISDISIKDETVQFLNKIGLSKRRATGEPLHVQLFDHHPTNTMNERYEWALVEEKDAEGVLQSAALLMYNELQMLLNPYLAPSLGIIVEQISRYDTWLWKTDPRDMREEYTNILIKQSGVVPAFQRLLKCLNASAKEEDDIFIFDDEAMALIDGYQYKRNESLKRMIQRGIVATTFQEYEIAIMLVDNQFVNESMEYVYEQDDSIDIVYGLEPLTRTLHLRSNKDDLNLGRFAKYYYNGGGHKKSAGAKLNTKKFMELLQQFYDGNDYIDSLEEEETSKKEEE